MIPADALRFVYEQAAKQAAAPIVVCDREPENVYYLRQPDGRLERTYSAAGPVGHQCLDVGSLVAVLVESLDPELGHNRAVWYSAQGVAALFDIKDQSEGRADFRVRFSKPFDRLMTWDRQPAALGHGEMVALLRVLFHNCLPNHPDLLTSVRKVDIKKVQEASGSIQRAGVSMSKAMVAEAAGADRLPEVLTFTVPVFDAPTLDTRFPVRCAFELDAHAEKFRVEPLPGEVDQAVLAAEDRLRVAVERELAERGFEGKVPVYHGTP